MANSQGRPTKYSTRTVNKILEGLRKGLPLGTALGGAGVAASTHHGWMQSKPGYADKVNDAIEEGESALVVKLLDDPASIRWLLSRRDPMRFGDPHKKGPKQIAEHHEAEIENLKARTEAIKDGKGSDGLAELLGILGHAAAKAKKDSEGEDDE